MMLVKVWCLIELTAVNEDMEVDQDTRCGILLIGWWVSLERVGRWR